LLGIGDMLLGDLDGVMIKVQSVSLTDQSLTVEVDFIKNIDMVTVTGVLPDGNEFTATQNMINPVEYTLAGEDNFSNPYSLGVRGSYQGTNASDQVDLSGSDVGYYIRMGGGNDTVVGTYSPDIFSLQSLEGGVKTIDGGSGNDAADIDLIGMFNGDPSNFGLNVQFDERTVTYTVFDSFADNMKEILTVRADTQTGGWTAESTSHGKEQFNLADKANLTNVESIRIFMGVDPEKNNEPVYRTLNLAITDKFIRTDAYTLDLRMYGFGSLIRVYGTDGSDVLNLPGIVLDQDLASRGIDASNVYFSTDSGGGDDTVIGGTYIDQLIVSSDGSNFLDGGGHSPYLGVNGNFYSGEDRAVIIKEIATREEFSTDDYVLLSVPALEAQDGDNAAVLLKDLGSSDVLSISSVVNLITGESQDVAFITSLLSQVSAKAVSLGIGDMALGELDGLLFKIQSEQEDGPIIDVDFFKDIGNVITVGLLPTGSGPGQSTLINPVQFTLDTDDTFNDPYNISRNAAFSNGIKGYYGGTNASDEVDLSEESVGYGFFKMLGGNDTIVGTGYADIFSLQGDGVYTIDGGAGDDVADIDVIGMYDGNDNNFGLNVQFDALTGTYTVFDSFADRMDLMLTVSFDNETGVWTAKSTDYGKEQFNLGDANLTNVESIRIFIGIDSEKNNEVVYQTLELVGVAS
jgi:uncharacterized protein involved in high-affinity Fe2+ transport